MKRLALVLCLALGACGDEPPTPAYKVGDEVQLVMGGLPAQVVDIWCRGIICLYGVRVMVPERAPQYISDMREFELRPVRTRQARR